MDATIAKMLEFLKGQSLQVAIVFIGVFVLTWLLRNKSAHVRYLLWLLVAIKCLTPPVVIFSVPVLPAETISVAIPAQPVKIDYQPIQNTVIAIQPDDMPSQTPIENRTSKIENISPRDRTSKIYPQGIENIITSTGSLLSVWAAGAACYLLWALGKAVRLAGRLRRIRRPLPAQLMIEQIEKLAKLWNYPGGFKVWLVDGITQPFVWGLWRGAIYLPTRFQSIEGDKQKAIVLHEMAHVVRFDAFVNLIQILIQGVFWFHPFVWLANRAIRQEREKCCDEIAVARLGTAPKEYGHAIVDTLLQEAKAGLTIPTLAVAGPVKNIEDRIKTIMQPGRRFFQRPSIVAMLIIGCLAALVVPTTIALTQKQEVVKESKIVMLSMKVKVIDENGKPVANAEIQPDGLRTTEKNSGHYFWNPETHGEPKIVLTDNDGLADISYPKYVVEKLKTGQVTFSVRHPEYCANRIFERSLKQPNPVVLKKGAIVRISGYIGNKEELVVSKIYPQASSGQYRILPYRWKEINPGVYECREIESGTNYLRLVHFTNDGKIYFSETLQYQAQQNQISEYNLELKPGVRVEGLLDHSIPRPVAGGRVIAWVAPAMVEKYAGSIAWMSWTTVDSDGRFVFESLPPDQLQLTGLCDGFTAAIDDDAWCVKPQLFALDKETVNIELLMKPAAICEVKVVDKANQPIQGAKVIFGQNIEWQGGGTQLFPGFLWKSEDTIAMDENEVSKLVGQLWKSDFQAITNDTGIAVVRNLPGLKDRFHVSHDNYEMIPDKKTRNSEEQEVLVDLVGGQTSTVTVKMQKKWKWLFWEKSKEVETQEPETASQESEEIPIADPNSQLSILNSQFVASLPNGVTVELVGICKNVSQNNWWKPDGKVLYALPRMDKQGVLQASPRENQYGYLFRLTGFSVHDTYLHTIEWEDGTVSNEFGIDYKNIPADLSGDIQLEIPAGQWDIALEIVSGDKQSYKLDTGTYQSVMIEDAFEEDGKAHLPSVFVRQLGETQYFMTFEAIDDNGLVYPAELHYFQANRKERSWDSIYEWKPVYRFDVKPEKIQRYRLKYRPIHVVTFKNVSLHPGQKTDAKVETSSAAVPALSAQEKNPLAPPGRGALLFDGIDDILQIHASKSLSLDGPFTIQIWIKPEFPETPDKQRNLLVKGGNVLDAPGNDSNRQAQCNGFAVTLSPYKTEEMIVESVTANGPIYGCGSFTEKYSGDWIPLVLKFNHDSAHYQPANNSDLIVGGEYLIPIGNHFKGQIGELRIWNRILTKDEIAYYKTNNVKGDEPGLAGCWTFEQNDGQKALDISINWNDARLGSTFREDKNDPTWISIEKEEEDIASPLRPGQKTDVKIEAQKPDAASRVSENNGQGEQVWCEPLNGLRMRVTAPEGTVYKRGISLPLVLEIQNVSDKPIAFNKFLRLDFKVTDQKDERVGVQGYLHDHMPAWENTKDSLQPGQIIKDTCYFERLRFNMPSPMKFIKLQFRLPTQKENPGFLPIDEYSNPVTIQLIDQPFKHLLKSEDLPEEWTKEMELVYREGGSIFYGDIAIRIDGNGRMTTVGYRAGGDQPAIDGRHEYLLEPFELNELLKSLREFEIERLNEYDNKIFSVDTLHGYISIAKGADTFSCDCEFFGHETTPTLTFQKLIRQFLVKTLAAKTQSSSPETAGEVVMQKSEASSQRIEVGVQDADKKTRPFAELLIPSDAAADLVPLSIFAPRMGHRDFVPHSEIPNLEQYSAEPRPAFMVPKGTVNVALNKTVTSSAKDILVGKLSMITDGLKATTSMVQGVQVELEGEGLQWITIDLAAQYDLQAIVLWHSDVMFPVYYDVIVQVSNDPTFKANVITLFNNDHDNSASMGIGGDKNYIEMPEGKLVDARGKRVRYVRLYSNGSATNPYNDYVEVEVYAVPDTTIQTHATDGETAPDGHSERSKESNKLTPPQAFADPNSQLPFTASLPNGVAVELVGLCEHPSEGKQWWAPDGLPLEQKITTKDSSHYEDKNKAFEIAYRISFPQGMTIDMPKVKGSTAQSGLEVTSPDGLKAIRTHLDMWGNTTTVSFPIAAGPWKTLGTTNGTGQVNTPVGKRKLMFSPAIGSRDKFTLTVSDDLEQFDDYRLIAVDKQGIVHTASRQWFSQNNLRQNTFTFTSLDPAAVDRYEFQSRPFENIEFKNVSLKPGKNTDVKIETEKPAVSDQRSIETQSPDTNQPHIALETSIMFLSFPEAPAGWSDDSPRLIGKMVMANADSGVLKKYLEPISLNQLGLKSTESELSDADPNQFPQNPIPSSIVHNARQLTLPKVISLNGQLNSFVLPESLNTDPASGLMYSVQPVMDTQNNKVNLKFYLRNFEKINSDKQAKPDTKSPDTSIFRIIEIPAYVSVPIGKTGVLHGPAYTDKDNKTGKTIFVQTLLKIKPTLLGPDKVGYYDKPQSD
jgi:beta-lactamase regulating signal transducer with metallopeptidase domain